MKKPSFFSFWKRKVFLVFLADAVFFSLLLWFLVFARNKIFSYLVVLQQFAPQISDVSSAIDVGNPASFSQLESLLKVIGPIVREANFFVYFAVPVVVFLIWVLFEGLSWSFLKSDFKAAFDIRFFSKFALLTIPFYALLVFLAFKSINSPEGYSLGLAKSVAVGLVLVLVFYFTVVLYLSFNSGKFFQRFFSLVKKSYLFFPLFLVLFFSLVLVLVLFFSVYISALTLSAPSPLSLSFLVFFILFFSSSKCLLVFFSE